MTIELALQPRAQESVEVWTESARRRFLNLDDFEQIARSILPPMLFTFVAEGVETNASLRGNRASFQEYSLLPRVLCDVSRRSRKTSLLGRDYAQPFGIAPMGGSATCAYRADLSLGGAAEAANIPMIVSAASVIRLEEIRQRASTSWFQAYLPAERERIEPMIDRVAADGYDTLVLTVDIPVSSNREHYVRSGFSIPLRPSFRLAWQGLSHPRWLLGTMLRTVMNHGMPHFENMDAYRGPPFLSRAATRQTGRRDALSWESVALMRKRWKGNFVVKGILSPDDAAKAQEYGADAVIVSNHGGRQLDGAIAPLHILPRIRDRVKDMPVIVDGGFRRGTDVLKALALGADFILIGRPFLYAAVAGGEAAVQHAISLLADEVDRDMAMLGVRELSAVNSNHITLANGRSLALA
jgi:L-lactate dehydrogenase (cytochrome)